jgi:hypothetical protein
MAVEVVGVEQVVIVDGQMSMVAVAEEVVVHLIRMLVRRVVELVRVA